ncbi:MAG: hypothetical protein ABJE10_24410 [bacterium]
MRRTNWKTVSTLVTLIVIAGCQDNMPSAPASASTGPSSLMMAPEGRPQLSLTGVGDQNASTNFTVGPSGGIFFVGSHAVIFPAHSICDPERSSYGPGTWDSPCEALKTPLKIHAEVRTNKEGSWVDFTPALRFVPSSDSRQWVWMYMSAPNARGAQDLSKFTIRYAPVLGAPSVDDGSLDPTVRTYVDTRGGMALRRIKHFSAYGGFLGSSGKACDPNVDSDCHWVSDLNW